MAEGYDLHIYPAPFEQVFPWAAAYALNFDPDGRLSEYAYPEGAYVPPFGPPQTCLSVDDRDEIDFEPYIDEAREKASELIESMPLLKGVEQDFYAHFNKMTELFEEQANPRAPREVPIFELRVMQLLPQDDVTLVEVNFEAAQLSYDLIGDMAKAPRIHFQRLIDKSELVSASFSIGQIGQKRNVGAHLEESESGRSRWSFHESGEVQDWEAPEQYKARRIKDRLPEDLMERYLRAIGVALDVYRVRRFARCVEFGVTHEGPKLDRYSMELDRLRGRMRRSLTFIRRDEV